MLCFRKFPVAKNSMDNKGVIKIFRRTFFVSLFRKFSQWNTFAFCFRKHPLAIKIKDNRGVIKIFLRQKFCLTVPKSFVGEHFYAAFEKISCSENFYG